MLFSPSHMKTDGAVYFKLEGWVFSPLTAVCAGKTRGLSVSPNKSAPIGPLLAAKCLRFDNSSAFARTLRSSVFIGYRADLES